MSDNQVSGCQLESYPVVKAQRAPFQVRPARTKPLSRTYSESSKSMYPNRTVGPYTASAARTRTRQIRMVRSMRATEGWRAISIFDFRFCIQIAQRRASRQSKIHNPQSKIDYTGADQ